MRGCQNAKRAWGAGAGGPISPSCPTPPMPRVVPSPRLLVSPFPFPALGCASLLHLAPLPPHWTVLVPLHSRPSRAPDPGWVTSACVGSVQFLFSGRGWVAASGLTWPPMLTSKNTTGLTGLEFATAMAPTRKQKVGQGSDPEVKRSEAPSSGDPTTVRAAVCLLHRRRRRPGRARPLSVLPRPNWWPGRKGLQGFPKLGLRDCCKLLIC